MMVAQVGKNLLPVQEMQEMWVQSPSWEDPLEEEMTAEDVTETQLMKQ